MTAWQMNIDTGGTFTDIVATPPEGNSIYAKVLSNGSLRGRIISVERLSGSDRGINLKIAHGWNTQQDIFEGYRVRLLEEPSIQGTVRYSHLAMGTLTINASVEDTQWSNREFEIFSGEEAPVLAARIITGTPLNASLPPMHLRLGTTKGTNALLEKKGAKVAFLVTKGFGDLMRIGTQQRPELFSLNIQRNPPLHHTVIEVEERLDQNGKVIQELTDGAIQQIIEKVKRSGCESIAIALLHSYVNPEHENLLAHACQKHGIPYISVSHALTPLIKLYPRAGTTLVNAYLLPVLKHYLQGISRALSRMGSSQSIMTSTGGLVGYQMFQPKDSLLSGPAGGVVGAAAMAKLAGIDHFISLDMGGTSTDVSRYHQRYDYHRETRVGAITMLSPAVAIETVAAGGGSLCGFDGNKLLVGPESAGAFPGPACYGAGGPLSLTDVNLLLGKLDPDAFQIPVSIQAAQKALDQMFEGYTEHQKQEALKGFWQIANEKMAKAIRRISIRKGYDPAEYSLLAFGGAGGQHACGIAEILGIQKILIPYEAGLLSAYGIGTAPIERSKSRMLLKPYDAVRAEIDQIIFQLKEETIDLLNQENISFQKINTQVSLFLRFLGQDHTIEIIYDTKHNIEALFEEKYRQIFGHWVENREVEVESVKILASGITHTQGYNQTPSQDIRPYDPMAYKYIQHVPVYRWENLQPGAEIQGQAILVSHYSTVYVEKGWKLSINTFRQAYMIHEQPDIMSTKDTIASEAARITLFSHRFQTIAEEMGALLERTAFSVNVKERLDFSCAVLDPDGKLIVNAPHIPVHLGSLGVCVRKVRETLEMGPGDVVITNHPGFGGSHLPDITLIAPVFTDRRELIGYVANRAHHAEIGGTRPGSMPPDAQNLEEEGVVIAPEYFVRKGNVRWEQMKKLFTSARYPTRLLDENMADLNAGLAALQLGQNMLSKLIETHGFEDISYYMKLLKRDARDQMRLALRQLDSGEYQEAEYLDDGTPLRLRMKIGKDKIVLDFKGTSDVHPGNLNANLAIVNSAVLYVFRLLVQKEIPLNEGIMELIEMNIPQGILNPGFSQNPGSCPAVVGGNVETSQRLVDLLLKPLKLAGCSQGTMNNVVFGNEHMGYYETIGGGTGAGKGFHGADAVHQHMTNTRITDPEILEFRYPVRLERFTIRRHSGGDGKWKGGNGIIRHYRFLEPMSVTVLTQHRKIPPYGMEGGSEGSCGKQYVIRRNGETLLLEGIQGIELGKMEQLIIETPGGGGYGKP